MIICECVSVYCIKYISYLNHLIIAMYIRYDKVQLKEDEDSESYVPQEQSEAILRMQEGNEALEELVSEIAMCNHSWELTQTMYSTLLN